MLLRARHYATGVRIDVRHDRGTIAKVLPAGTDRADREAGWVAPALFDLQINGCLGISFNSPSLTGELAGRVVDECAGHGIGGLLPTLVTNSFPALAHGFATLQHEREAYSVVGATAPEIPIEGTDTSPGVVHR